MQESKARTAEGTNPAGGLQTSIQAWLEEWEKLWRESGLADDTRVELSSRMTRTLGRAYPARMLIRLNSALTVQSKAEALKEVFCHEVAHLVTFRRYGREARPHGREWRQLVEAAGYRPTATSRVKSVEPGKPKGNPLLYVHSCPVCGARRTAGKPMYRWFCLTCRDAGLAGRLLITTRPRQQESSE